MVPTMKNSVSLLKSYVEPSYGEHVISGRAKVAISAFAQIR